jgi:hypothetical protein
VLNTHKNAKSVFTFISQYNTFPNKKTKNTLKIH